MNDAPITTEQVDRAPEAGILFESLARMVYEGDDIAAIHQAIVDAAPLLVPGVDRASLMLHRHNRFETAAYTDDVALAIDEAERRLVDGPCVDAILDEAAQLEPNFVESSNWPRLAAYIVENTPVRGGAGFRIVVDERKVGALNLWSDTPGLMNTVTADHAAVLAAFSSMAVAADHHRLQAASLRRGLLGNREIGKAVGLLMAFHKVNDEKAWQILRETSRDLQMKVADVAREILEHHNNR
jgi:hypothetical protein